MHYAPGAWKNDTTELYAKKQKQKKPWQQQEREMRRHRERSIQERSKQLTCHADRGAESGGGRGETTAGEPD